MSLAGSAWGTPTPNQINGPTVSLRDSVEFAASTAIANGVLLEPFPRKQISSAANVIGATGQLYFIAVAGIEGQVIGHLGLLTGTTPASTPTHTWMVLADRLLNGLAWTADQTTTALAASTAYSWAIATTVLNPLNPTVSATLATATTFTLPYTGLYYIGFMNSGTTIPTGSGEVTTAAAAGLAPILNGTSTTPGAVGPPTAATAYSALTALVGASYLVASV